MRTEGFAGRGQQNETLRKLRKLARGVATGKTKCNSCNYVVRARLPWRILIELGRHHEEDHA